MARSEAEKIYNAWSTRSSRATVSSAGRASGAFDAYRKNGFDGVVSALSAHLKTKGTQATAEQTWKLLEKFKRRHSQSVAHELLTAIQADLGLRSALHAFPATMFGDLSDEARENAQRIDLKNLVFPRSGKRVAVGKKLGQGGMGGAVYLGKDQCGVQYAVKHMEKSSYAIPQFGGLTPRDHLVRTQHHLAQLFEASLTGSCIDTLTIGRHEFMLLQLGEGPVDYSTLNMSDLISVFQDLQTVYEFSKNYMNVEITQDVSILHLDIHGENMMRFNGRLRLIDFGKALAFNPSQGEEWRRAKMRPYDRTNPELYYQGDDIPFEGNQGFNGVPTKGRRLDFIVNWQKAYRLHWQKAYREGMKVQVCNSCKRQYPAGSKITTCYACGSSKITTADLRLADRVGLANLQGKSPSSTGNRFKGEDASTPANPYANRGIPPYNAQQYGCVVLTAVLIKEIWCATEAGKTDLGMGAVHPKSILNQDAYTLARQGLHAFKDAAPGTGGVMEWLLSWYDEMMKRIFDSDPFAARDAVKFFGGMKSVRASRERRHSVSF